MIKVRGVLSASFALLAAAAAHAGPLPVAAPRVAIPGAATAFPGALFSAVTHEEATTLQARLGEASFAGLSPALAGSLRALDLEKPEERALLAPLRLGSPALIQSALAAQLAASAAPSTALAPEPAALERSAGELEHLRSLYAAYFPAEAEQAAAAHERARARASAMREDATLDAAKRAARSLDGTRETLLVAGDFGARLKDEAAQRALVRAVLKDMADRGSDDYFRSGLDALGRIASASEYDNVRVVAMEGLSQAADAAGFWRLQDGKLSRHVVRMGAAETIARVAALPASGRRVRRFGIDFLIKQASGATPEAKKRYRELIALVTAASRGDSHEPPSPPTH
ncbi:MAG: hypothetical protein HY078_01565 [Elusimicrobia bacterium]|nr:hypothetical protein [Elusimicrobiota bacterium]